MQQIAKYLPIIQSLAEQALGMAVDGSPTRPAAGQRVVSMMRLVPVAQAAIGGRPSQTPLAGVADAMSDPQTRWVDGFGHHRPVYRALCWHLLNRVGCHAGAAPRLESQAFHAVWWQRLIDHDAGLPVALAVPSTSGVGPQPMHKQTLDDAPEDWTYRDMAAMHAVFGVASRMAADGDPGAEAWFDRCRLAAEYHLDHTQPDYTTYQPWGLPAFLLSPQTAYFAEQQLHDVQSHLHLSGPGGALVPGLLLADCVSLLGQRLESVEVSSKQEGNR